MRSPDLVWITIRPSSARCPPRARSRTVPSARTMVNASTQSRVVPYLKVAAPAALVATIPPAVAPVNVGAGGNQPPTAASACCIASTVTPGSTVMLSRPTSSTRFIRAIDRIVSPIGVAPPVSDDWAPIGSTVQVREHRLDNVRNVAGNDQSRGVTTGKVAGVGEEGQIVVSHQSLSRQSVVSQSSVSRQQSSVVPRHLHFSRVGARRRVAFRPRALSRRSDASRYLISPLAMRAISSPRVSCAANSSAEM